MDVSFASDPVIDTDGSNVLVIEFSGATLEILELTSS